MKRQSYIFLYGAPASGKSTLAKALGKALNLTAIDLDEEIVARIKMPIAQYFSSEGEEAFRDMESRTLAELLEAPDAERRIIALGGGTLLRQENRELCENNGYVFCLDTPEEEELCRRLEAGGKSRPLGNQAKSRAEHYASFESRISRSFALPDSLVLVGHNIASPFFIDGRCVIDGNVSEMYPELAEKALHVIPSGEIHKTPQTIMNLWHAFAQAKIGRVNTVVACGGGVTSDLTGFAAATWMRGIPWINIPTTLLAMVDASTGGKTGCDLPEGKNLAGAFHSPRLVVIDTVFLNTLPESQLRSGYGEMIKHFAIGNKPGKAPELHSGVPTAAEIAQSLAVKVDIVRQDPRETLGLRILLNCGHTIGHAVEAASNYQLSHGESIAIGCVLEAKMAVEYGLAPADWPTELAAAFQTVGLPTELPGYMTYESLLERIRLDKKQANGIVTFALPCGWGDVRPLKVKV